MMGRVAYILSWHVRLWLRAVYRSLAQQSMPPGWHHAHEDNK
jgi:hypothetical protein